MQSMNNHLQCRIVCAAMLMQNGDIVTGIRHFSLEMRSIMRKAYGEKYHLQVEHQGFVDQFCKFYQREEAWKIARMNGQIIRPTGWEPVVVDNATLPEEGRLFSENLY